MLCCAYSDTSFRQFPEFYSEPGSSTARCYQVSVLNRLEHKVEVNLRIIFVKVEYKQLNLRLVDLPPPETRRVSSN